MPQPEICRLCQQHADLCKSHILPEFFYKEIYDSTHRIQVVSSEHHLPESYIQKGLYEKLLCGSCEQKFAVLEKYVKETFVDGNGLMVTQQSHAMLVQGFDYTKFKLFLLSLLWRMGVSCLEPFECVQLGRHEETIRQALLDNDPFDSDRYPCILTGVLIDRRVYTDWIIPPSLVRAHGLHCYRVVINGILYAFWVGRAKLPAKLQQLVLTKAGSLIIPVTELRDVPFLRQTAMELGQAIRIRKARRKSKNRKE